MFVRHIVSQVLDINDDIIIQHIDYHTIYFSLILQKKSKFNYYNKGLKVHKAVHRLMYERAGWDNTYHLIENSFHCLQSKFSCLSIPVSVI